MIVDVDDFISMLDEERRVYESQTLNFNDEIISIEYIGEVEMIDFAVSDNQLFYANNILIHNCATNNTQADNSAVSDSYGSVMTADMLMFLLQTEEMKANGDIICKITKNRFSGKTETFPMRVDYTLMRFEDPEMPKSLEARAELRAQFEDNVKQVEPLLKEHYHNDIQNAKQHDAKLQNSKVSTKVDLAEELADVWDSIL